MRQFAARYGENESPISGKTRIFGVQLRRHAHGQRTLFSDRPRPTQEILIPRGSASGGSAPSLQYGAEGLGPSRETAPAPLHHIGARGQSPRWQSHAG